MIVKPRFESMPEMKHFEGMVSVLVCSSTIPTLTSYPVTVLKI